MSAAAEPQSGGQQLRIAQPRRQVNFVAPTLGGQAPLIQTLQLDAQIDHVVATTTASTWAPARQHAPGLQPIVQDRQVEFTVPVGGISE